MQAESTRTQESSSARQQVIDSEREVKALDKKREL